MSKKNVSHLNVSGKRVLIRVDFNVPVDSNGHITDDRRIVAALPTIKSVLDRGGVAVLMSHLGRPKAGPEPKFSLKPVAKRLQELLGRPVQMAPDCIGPTVEQLVAGASAGTVVLLENTRFHKEEEKNDAAFAALRQKERIGHRSTDQNRIRLGKQVLDYGNFVRDLGPAQNCHKGTRRITKRLT